jgi:hypothetical protein
MLAFRMKNVGCCIETRFISTRTPLPLQKNEQKEKKKVSTSWPKWSIPRLHRSSAKLWLHKCTGEVLLEKVASYRCVHVTIAFHLSSIWVLQWLTYLAATFDSQQFVCYDDWVILCGTQFPYSAMSNYPQWHFLPVVHMLRWTNNQ